MSLRSTPLPEVRGKLHRQTFSAAATWLMIVLVLSLVTLFSPRAGVKQDPLLFDFVDS